MTTGEDAAFHGSYAAVSRKTIGGSGFDSQAVNGQASDEGACVLASQRRMTPAGFGQS
jgi:hypothetical protein